MTKDFDVLTFVGRMQPFHLGHKRVIDQALDMSDHVLILLGSSFRARTVRNPFTFEERRDMILGSYGGLEDRVLVRPLRDFTYNDSAWVLQVQDTVREVLLDLANPTDTSFRPNGTNDLRVGLIGASKDSTSYYLKLFPQWDSVDVPVYDMIHATGVRDGLLSGVFERYQLQDTVLPKSTCDFLFKEGGFVHTQEYRDLRAEHDHVKRYQVSWRSAPYPVKQVTVDAVVEQSGHVLLVKRRSAPGRGLWAIPGGHLEVDEKIEDGVLRELREETKIKVPDAVLRGSIVGHEVFDDPFRSTIGRVITHAYHFRLRDDVRLPKVKGADDAERAVWVPISELREDQMFDDHYHVISYFLGLGGVDI